MGVRRKENGAFTASDTPTRHWQHAPDTPRLPWVGPNMAPDSLRSQVKPVFSNNGKVRGMIPMAHFALRLPVGPSWYPALAADTPPPLTRVT